MMKLQIITTTTSIGDFRMITEQRNGEDIVRASGFTDIENLTKRLPEELQDLKIEAAPDGHPYQQAVEAYFSGDKNALDSIVYEQKGAPFTQKVWEAMSTIEYGKVLSYKELALAAGNPAAIRAAGTACGANHLVLLVPCHRIVKTGGGLGNFLDGTNIKERLLKFEGAIE